VGFVQIVIAITLAELAVSDAAQAVAGIGPVIPDREEGIVTTSSEVGIFDLLTTGSFFKTAPDGRKLFCPWGALGRSYVIPSEQDYARSWRQIKIFWIVSMVLLVGFVAALSDLGVLIIGPMLFAFYLAWMLYFLHRLQPAEEKLSLRERMLSQARAHGATTLWLHETISLAFVAIGVVMLLVLPHRWPTAVLAIVVFGIGAVSSTCMLLLLRRSRASEQS
jgi:hypothetical protein